jgi:hypothetical protein
MGKSIFLLLLFKILVKVKAHKLLVDLDLGTNDISTMEEGRVACGHQ